MRAETAVKQVDMLSPIDRRGDRTNATGGWPVGNRMAGWIPTDARSILLLVGYVALLGLGLINLLEADISGAVLVAGAVLGFIFVRGRLLNLVVWLGVLVIGLTLVAGADLRGIVFVGAGLVGAVVAAWPDAAMLMRWQSGAVPLPEPEEQVDEPEPSADLRLRTINRLALLADDGTELTAALLDRRIVAFIWLYLLARSASGGDPRLTRPALADEIYPRVDPTTQKQRLRGQLRDIQELPPRLARRVHVDGDLITLDLAGCDFDAQALRLLAAKCREAGILPKTLKRRAAALLADIGSGLFLPGWEELEHRVTGGRGGASEVVNAARRQVADDRADLAAALASTLIAEGDPSNAIRPLEDAMAGAPHREDLVQLLVAACLRTGQTARAKELQAEYGIKEKV